MSTTSHCAVDFTFDLMNFVKRRSFDLVNDMISVSGFILAQVSAIQMASMRFPVFFLSLQLDHVLNVFGLR